MLLFQYALKGWIVLIDSTIDEWWLADIVLGIRVWHSPSQKVAYH